jgi:hypothetical protein
VHTLSSAQDLSCRFPDIPRPGSPDGGTLGAGVTSLRTLSAMPVPTAGGSHHPLLPASLPPADEWRDPLIIIDLDSPRHGGTTPLLDEPPPPDLDSSLHPDGLANCVCWSVQNGFAGVHETPWAPLVRHTIVGQPRQSEYMVEAVLCRVLMLALTAPPTQAEPSIVATSRRGWRLKWEPEAAAERPPTMTAGGRWEVDTKLLSPPEALGDESLVDRFANGDKSDTSLGESSLRSRILAVPGVFARLGSRPRSPSTSPWGATVAGIFSASITTEKRASTPRSSQASCSSQAQSSCHVLEEGSMARDAAEVSSASAELSGSCSPVVRVERAVSREPSVTMRGSLRQSAASLSGRRSAAGRPGVVQQNSVCNETV